MAGKEQRRDDGMDAADAAPSLGRLPLRWVRMALVYFLVAVTMGVAMAATHDHRLKGVHVHLNMLGWVSMALFAWLYQQFPRAAASKWASVHFWLYSLAMPVSMAGLAGVLLGDARFMPIVAGGSVLALLSVVIFVGLLLVATLVPQPRAAGRAAAAAV